MHEGGFAVVGTAGFGAVVEARQRCDCAHAAGAVVGDGEWGDHGGGVAHELALGPGNAGDLFS